MAGCGEEDEERRFRRHDEAGYRDYAQEREE
jgi:hypothetical protein